MADPKDAGREQRGNEFSTTGNRYQTYQRGGSGSEGGSSEDQSYGPARDLSERGGGTGIRENESGGANANANTQSDGHIREDIKQRLASHPEIEGDAIAVEVQDGIVTLSGTVGDPAGKRRAEDVAANVAGVKQVRNTIGVEARSGGR